MTQESKTILVGVDFSAGSERALVKALELAKAMSASLHVVHIYEPLAVAASEPTLLYTDMLGRIQEEKLARRNQCTELCDRIIADRVPVAVHVYESSPLEGLLDAIETLKPELVVVGSHGRGAIMRLLLGSVSAALCRRSPIPVVVVPSPEHAHEQANDKAREQASDPKQAAAQSSAGELPQIPYNPDTDANK